MMARTDQNGQDAAGPMAITLGYQLKSVERHQFHMIVAAEKPQPELTDATAPLPPAPLRMIAPEESIDRSARRVIEPYSPVYFVINRKHDVVRFSGPDAGDYLEPSAGSANLNLFSLLRRTLRPAVRAAVLKAETERRRILQEVSAPAADGRDTTVSLIIEQIEF